MFSLLHVRHPSFEEPPVGERIPLLKASALFRGGQVEHPSEVVVFVAELMLNFIGFGFQRFFCGPDCWWNCFDFAPWLARHTEWFPGDHRTTVKGTSRRGSRPYPRGTCFLVGVCLNVWRNCDMSHKKPNFQQGFKEPPRDDWFSFRFSAHIKDQLPTMRWSVYSG